MLWLPGVIWVAELVYRWVSRNRHLLSRLFGCKEACTLLPTRDRPQDVKPDHAMPLDGGAARRSEP